MKIVNNRLVGGGVKFMQSPNTSGSIKAFKFLLVHDDFGASMAGTESWILNPESKVSYHVLVGKKGEVTQFVDFNKRAYHAGKSTWKGLSDLNWYSIGVAMQNRNKEPYTEEQIAKYIEVCKVIADHYGIKEAVGHKQVSPGRKFDPNDHFPWSKLNEAVFGIKTDNTAFKTKMTSTDVNLRSSPGTNKPPIETIKKSTFVKVFRVVDSSWSEVEVNGKKGFMATNYLI